MLQYLFIVATARSWLDALSGMMTEASMVKAQWSSDI